jgi:hypothetical protein
MTIFLNAAILFFLLFCLSRTILGEYNGHYHVERDCVTAIHAYYYRVGGVAGDYAPTRPLMEFAKILMIEQTPIMICANG